MSLVEENDFYESFDILWDVGKYEDAIRLYEFLKRPFWLAEKIGSYFESIHQFDRAMFEYEHLINAYLKMGPNFLPLPGGPVELYKLGKWFIKTDPAKSEKYLRLYIQADDINRGEPNKTTYRTEAMQLMEVLMKNKRDYIKQRLNELHTCPNVIPLRGGRTMPNAMSVALHPQSRIGLWWYQPITGEMFFSVSAGHHLKLNEFVGIKDVRGGARGAIFQRDDLNYLLIYKCDLKSEVLSGRIFVDIYEKAQKLSGMEITGGIFDEEGRDLLGNNAQLNEQLNASSD